MLGGQALGWMAGTLIWMPGTPGARRANVPSNFRLDVTQQSTDALHSSHCPEGAPPPPTPGGRQACPSGFRSGLAG